MSFPSFAKCRTYQFSFKRSEALYRDHRGERVLADVEGAGEFLFNALPESTTIFVDGIPASSESRLFSESLIVTSKSDGLSEISVRVGPEPRFIGLPQTLEKFVGSGWILESEGLSTVDESLDGWAEMAQLQPIPVMTEASGKRLKIQAVDQVFRSLATIDLTLPESLREHGWEVKNASKLFQLLSILPGYGLLEREVLSHLNGGSFEIAKPAGCEAIVIRKLYDAFHGRQRARVLVDGKFHTWWYEPIEDRRNRWRWGHIGIETGLESRSMRIEIDPPAGSPLWSVSKIEVFGLWTGG